MESCIQWWRVILAWMSPAVTTIILLSWTLLCHFWVLRTVLWLFTLTAQSKFSAHTHRNWTLEEKKTPTPFSFGFLFSIQSFISTSGDAISPSTFAFFTVTFCQRTERKSLFLHLWKKQAIYIDCSGQYKPAGLLIFSLCMKSLFFFEIVEFFLFVSLRGKEQFLTSHPFCICFK